MKKFLHVFKKKQAQSTVEYLLILAVVVSAITLFKVLFKDKTTLVIDNGIAAPLEGEASSGGEANFENHYYSEHQMGVE